MQQDLILLLDRLRALPQENEWVEFKHNFHSAEEIGERISGIANSASLHNRSVGYLVFGIRDEDHEAVGTDFSANRKRVGKGAREELEHWLIQRLEPRIDFRIHEFDYQSKPIVLFEIPAAESRPVDFLHVPYIRIGSVNRRLSEFPEKERKIWSRAGEDFEYSIALDRCSAADVVRLLDTQAYFDLLQYPYPQDQNGVLERLSSQGLVSNISPSGYAITNAGAILLAKDLGEFPKLSRKSIRVVVYEGRDKLRTIQDEEFTQGYAVGFAQLVRSVHRLLPRNEQIGQALRTETSMYPPLALRELIANALIHQDFSISGTSPMIEIYSDRIEFSNPGRPLVETTRFIDEYRSRNEKIASLMRRMGICEEKGSGIDKVIFSCELYQLPPPSFQSNEVHTKVVLYAYKQLNHMDKAEKLRAVYQHACLKWVSNDAMTNQSLRKRFEIADHNYSIVSRLIGLALKEKLIKEADPESRSKKYAKYLPYWA